MYVTEYIVEGVGSFPLDMLRYDASYPADSSAVDAIQHDGPPVARQVRLCTRHTHKNEPGITVGRWNSFGWAVHQTIRTRRV